MLSIRVGRLFYSIPSKKITHIEYVDTLTALPFTHPSIEGLVNYNGRPLLQINVADALALAQVPQQGRKRLIVNTKQGLFALRVDEVSRLDKVKMLAAATENQQPLPRLHLHALLPRIIKTKQPAVALPEISAPGVEEQKLTVLLVVSGDKTVALLIHNIDHIQDMGGLSKSLAGQNMQGDFLIKVDGQLIATHSLGHLLRLKDTGAEPFAVIVRSSHITWALRVQRVIGMETVGQVYSSGSDAQGLCQVMPVKQIHGLIDYKSLMGSGDGPLPHLWYVTQEGQIRELFNADSLLAGNYHPQDIRITVPQAAPRTSQFGKGPSNQGLRIFCGGESYFLPLTMAARAMDSLDLSAMARLRFPTADRSNRTQRIPWIDANALLFGKRNTVIKNTVAINLANGGQILLGVGRLQLSQPLSASESWVNIDLPFPLTLLFDTACYDVPTRKWVLQVVGTVQFASLPWTLKKSLAKAIIGWFDRHW
ncbi:MAG: chemotaxis protein CheW [Methylovulum sp.]|nr:chemotaxis protein CheW [Methylovulum sp.]